MTELSRLNPTDRFTGLADVYARHRPSYPDAALDCIISRCGLTSASLLVDVGCGTGISSRLFARRGVPVVGVEPNGEMRARAEAEPVPPGCPAPTYRDGTGEATGLPGESADVVLAAQAFHWFQSEAALREFLRVLKPGGWVVLMWNDRDESDAFTAAYGDLLRQFSDAAAIEGPRGRAGQALLDCPLYEERQRVVFPNQQAVDVEGLLGRAFSTSYAPREPAAAQAFADGLRQLFDRRESGGQVVLCYETSVYFGRRPGGRSTH